MRVINMSAVSPGRSAALDHLIGAAGEAGIVVVVPSGNKSDDPRRCGANRACYPSHPAQGRTPNLLVVGGLSPSGCFAAGALAGRRCVDLAAPAGYITGGQFPNPTTNLSCGDAGGVRCSRVTDRYFSGTSFAAPIVAATASLVAELNPTFTAAQIVERVRATVVHDPRLTAFVSTGGRVNLYRALAGPDAGDPGAETQPDASVSCSSPDHLLCPEAGINPTPVQ